MFGLPELSEGMLLIISISSIRRSKTGPENQRYVVPSVARGIIYNAAMFELKYSNHDLLKHSEFLNK